MDSSCFVYMHYNTGGVCTATAVYYLFTVTIFNLSSLRGKTCPQKMRAQVRVFQMFQINRFFYKALSVEKYFHFLYIIFFFIFGAVSRYFTVK